MAWPTAVTEKESGLVYPQLNTCEGINKFHQPARYVLVSTVLLCANTLTV